MPSDHAILIRKTRFSEASLILHWWTEQHGLVTLVAKGISRPKHPLYGQIDLFVEGVLTWKESQKSDLDYLLEFSGQDFHLPIRKSYRKTVIASYFAQLVDRCVEAGLPIPGLYQLLRRAFGYLDREEGDAKGVRFFEKELVSVLDLSHERLSPIQAILETYGSLPKSYATCWELLGEEEG